MWLIALLIDGIVQGLQFSLLAVGLTLIFGLGGVLNLAHGQFAVIAGMVTALLLDQGLDPVPASAAGVLATGLFGFLVDRSLLLPAYRYSGETRLLLGLLLTLGLSFVIEGFLNYSVPYVALSLHLPWPSVRPLGIPVRTASIVVSLLAILALGALLLFLRRTPLGKAIRSIMQNEVGAALCGIDPARMRTLIFTLGALLAGLVGITQGLFASLGPEMGLELTVFALIVTTVGGVRSIHGTIAAGVLLGIVHAFASFYIGAYVTFIILLATAALTILWRPSGLLGYWT
ncbi:MAG: branched-chain amino acid ABC transporter permease [Candidatus Tectimicrobiota bacterium]|nr:MAG: branched-chain amino acid ABC transporter permease [Candidatus Tectomicrobia bacterium]